MSKTRILREHPVELPSGSWVAIALFVILVAFLGGSSRPDAVQIAALRPMAALFLIPALYMVSRDNMRDFRTPFLLLSGLFLLMLAQLFPLPASMWQALPGRDAVTALGEVTGTQNLWRPLSLVPARTLNALLSLVIPITALLLIAASGLRRTQLFILVAAIGVADATLAIAQIISGGHEALYFYAVTNSGTAVGLFANQNHSAVFGAVALLVIGYLISEGPARRWPQWQRLALFGGFMIVLLSALTGGSRAGLLATIVALIASGLMYWIGAGANGKRGNMPTLFGRHIRPSFVLLAGALIVAGVFASFVLFDRVPALRTLADAGSFDDLRWRLLPTLQTMIGTYWIFGSGFGSFEEVYHIFEPTALLVPTYVNQAHNDWAQLLIEGGIVAVILLAFLFVWFVRRLFQIGDAGRHGLRALLLWVSVLGIIIFASLVDYPLRTPLFQLVSVILIAALCREHGEQAQ